MIIEAKNLTKTFQLSKNETLHAVDNVTLGINQHEILGLVGESGSGKTTFGKALIGLHNKTGGKVYFEDMLLPQHYSAEDFKNQSSKIQFIFQDPYSSLNPRMTILELIAEGLCIRDGVSLSKVRDNVASWLEKVGLSADHMARYPHEFSGGQRQRVGIARALIVNPKLVICDEPISALDVSVQAQVVHLLEELKDSMGLSLLFIAHDLSMVRYISNRMAVMYLGSIVEVGPSNSIYFEPKHPYTQILVKSNPEPDPALAKEKTTMPIIGEIPSPVNLGDGCRFASRCPYVESRCKTERPILKAVSAMQETSTPHQVACHLVNE